MTVARRYLPVLLVLLAIGARLLPGPRTIDDAYITFRYARNLLAGEGFVYNPGERVQGTTTPLYTFLLTGLAAVTGGAQADFPSLALGINALADGLTCLLLYQIGRRLNLKRAGIAAALVWVVAPFSVTFAIGGLETSLYVLFLTGAFYFYLANRRTLVALLAAAALLTRLDALLLLAPLGLDWLYHGWRDPGARVRVKDVLAFAIPVALWFGFAWLYFGSPLPHSMLAKLSAYRLNPNDSFIRLLQHYATPFMEEDTFGSTAIKAGLVLYPFLYLVGALRAWRSDRRSLPWLLYPWLYFIAFSLPNPLIFRWYLTPPLPAYIFFILAGMDILLTSLFALRGRAPLAAWRSLVPLALLVALPLGFSLRDWRLHPDHAADRPAPEMAYIQLELLYRQAAAVVSPMETPESTLAAGDVGVLGYFTPGKILDTVGLNSPESLAYYPLDKRYYAMSYAVAPDLIINQHPDFVIILEVYGRDGLLKDPRFIQEYQLIEKIPTDVYGSDGMLLYRRAPDVSP